MSVSLSPIGGYKGTVALSCSGVPLNAQCVYQPEATVSLADAAVGENMVFDTSQLFESGTQLGRIAGRSGPVLAVVFFPLLALLGETKVEAAEPDCGCCAVRAWRLQWEDAGIYAARDVLGDLDGQ